jgi:AcrR family transcriptional regulator
METPAATANLPLRQRQALETRRRIAAAARELFAVRGYPATTIDAIAERAGVAQRTVYAAYRTKQYILGAVCALWLEQAGIREAWARALDGDAQAGLAGIAEVNRRLWEHGLDVVRILHSATGDPMAERLLHGWTDDQAGAVRAALTGVAGSFRPGMELEAAMVLVRALSVPEVYIELTGQGWSPDRYEAWLTETLEQQILGRRPAGRWLKMNVLNLGPGQ